MEQILKCPNCQTHVTATGTPGETVILTCPKCGSKGKIVFPQKYREEPEKTPEPTICTDTGKYSSIVQQLSNDLKKKLSILKNQYSLKEKRKLNWHEFFTKFFKLDNKNQTLETLKQVKSAKKKKKLSWNDFFKDSIKQYTLKKQIISIGYMIGVFIIVTMILLLPLTLLGLGGNVVLLIPGLIILGAIFAFISVFLIVPFSLRKKYHKFSNPPTELVQIANDYSTQFGLKRKIHLRYCETPEINAMTYSSLIGHNICFTTGILNAYSQGDLSSEELRSIIGHEFGHIIHNDVFRNSFVTSWSSIFKMVGNYFMVLGLGFAGVGLVVGVVSREGGSGIAMVVVGWAMIVSGMIMRLIAKIADIFAFNYARRQEYTADLTGAELTNPTILAQALDKLWKLEKQYELTQLAKLPYSERWTIQPRNVSFIDRLFSSHPPIEKRIARLRELGKYS